MFNAARTRSRRTGHADGPACPAAPGMNWMGRMMDGMGGMMWAAGLLWLLLIVVLVLAAAALVKYLRSDRSR